MKELSRREGTTMFMNLLGALQLVLSRYTSQTDITVGTDIANRNRVETEGLIGFFVNELAMRNDLSGNPTIHELLTRMKKTALEAFDHQDLPFEKLVEELQPERDLERHPIFQISLVLQNAPEKRLKLAGVEAKPFDSGETRPKLDLELVFTDDPEEGLRGSITYATDLFDESTIQRFGGHFCAALEMLAADPEQKISELDLLSASERTALLVIPNTTSVAFPRKCVQQLFEEQVKKMPTAVAVECGGVESQLSRIEYVGEPACASFAQSGRWPGDARWRLYAPRPGPVRELFCHTESRWRLCAAGPGLSSRAAALYGGGF